MSHNLLIRQEKKVQCSTWIVHVLSEPCAARRLPSVILGVLDGVVRGLGDIRVDAWDVMSFNNGLAPIYRN